MPKRITMSFAVAVTASRSSAALVVTWLNTICSAARPARATAIRSSSIARDVSAVSSVGSVIVCPSDWPRGRIEIVWIGSAWGR
jgi:hypothetical protein